MLDFIDKFGVEFEGWFKSKINNDYGKYHEDGSVEFEEHGRNCEGNCRDNCNCYDDCDCNQCIVCRTCECTRDNCDCEECLYCNDCDNSIDDCACIIEKICKNIECVESNRCEICQDNFTESRNIIYLCGNVISQCDASCNCECECECDCYDGFSGEFVSNPLKNESELKQFFEFYPDEVNSSCGMHCHFSFKDDKKSYYILNSNRFYEFFMEKIKQWAIDLNIREGSRFWKRYQGENRYVLKGWNGNQQIKNEDKDSSRYHILNFSYNCHKTLEIRLLPMFDKKELGLFGILQCKKIINEYLNNNKNFKQEFEF